MKRKPEFRVVLVTAPDLRTARRLAHVALENRLAACVNLVAGVESHYWWQGKRERGREVMMILKTTGAALRRLEACLLRVHPYDTAEFIALPVSSGAARYLDWVQSSVSGRSRLRG
jgi:periplasmic divalent cation tolerance protein